MQVAEVRPNPGKSLSDEHLGFVESGEAEALDARQILIWGMENFAPELSLSCSFGAPEGLVVLDMMHRIDAASRVFTIDTGRLPQATHDLVDRVRDRYAKRVEVLFPREDDVREMTEAHGSNLFYESVSRRQHCCRVRKVEPLRRYLATQRAWVTGLRRDQGVTRSELRKIEIDHANGGLVKLNPIADWTHERVMEYVRSHDVPVNRLHGAGYPSIGCEPCSRAVAPDADPRSGRWWWEKPETRECGIHVEEEQGSGI